MAPIWGRASSRAVCPWIHWGPQIHKSTVGTHIHQYTVRTTDTSFLPPLSRGPGAAFSLSDCSDLAVAMEDHTSPPASSGYSHRCIPCPKPCHADCSASGWMPRSRLTMHHRASSYRTASRPTGLLVGSGKCRRAPRECICCGAYWRMFGCEKCFAHHVFTAQMG